jgi:hypothetical protein
MEISIKPKRIAMIFATVSLIMVLGHIGGRITHHFFGRTFGFYFFDINREDSIPTFVASMGLGICSFLLFVVAYLVKRNKLSDFLYWIGLAVFFLYMAIDETVRIHEKMGGPLREVIDPEALYDMVWLIPYGAVTILIGIVYLRFILRLPRETKLLFVASGLIYLLGAVGFEYLSGRQDALYGVANFGYQLFVILEEGLELMGAAVFMYSILNHIRVQFGTVRFILHAKPAIDSLDE